MIELSKTSVMNFENAIRGMRNPLQSYEKSDSFYCGEKWYGKPCYHFYEENGECRCDLGSQATVWDEYEDGKLYILGKNDLDLAQRLCKAGSDDRKFLREILVSVDIKAPLYWFKEYDTYKVATVANSTSTMHTIHKREFILDDFSHEHLTPRSAATLNKLIEELNYAREEFLSCVVSKFLTSEDCREQRKIYWWQMIQLLPSSYNQLRTCTLNYEVLRNIYHARKNHKLTEWHDFCRWIESLPYAKELITDEADH